MDRNDAALLQSIARRVMAERGLLPDFSAEALAELDKLQASAPADDESIRDMRDVLWCSIDNDDSRDLDQLTAAEAMPGGLAKIRIAVADVDALVKNRSAINEHAQHNTTSVYTAAEIFPMLPERLSTDLTSLNPGEDRLAIITEIVIGADGSLADSAVYRGRVRNHAKLAYNAVGAWLEANEAVPDAIAAVPGLEENLRLQDEAAQKLKAFRHIQGALSLETIEAKPVFEDDKISDLEVQRKNRATEIIEDFMISANGVIARYLASAGMPCIRRVVRTPRRWDRIVEVAAQHNYFLPAEPDSKALEQFLTEQKAADPVRFPDLSLSIIKLMGAGEYVAELPGGSTSGHFGLAVRDYAHSTAPNRRFPDLITQRLLKAALDKAPSPYSDDELEALAAHCTEAEDDAKKVERQVGKSAAALLLESRIGDEFNAMVTGVSDAGTWVRLLDTPIEGKLVRGADGLDVGDWIQVRLKEVDVQRGFIDFVRVG